MNEPKGPLQVLIVEDSENDAELLELELERSGYEPHCQRVESVLPSAAAPNFVMGNSRFGKTGALIRLSGGALPAGLVFDAVAFKAILLPFIETLFFFLEF